MLLGLYTRTAGKPIQAIQQILEALWSISQRKDVHLHFSGVGTTGSGRKFIGSTPVHRQSDEDLCKTMPDVDRFRYAAPDRDPEAVLIEASRTGFFISRAPVLMEGRIELLQYFIEQSICNTYHRYGNLGERAVSDSFTKDV